MHVALPKISADAPPLDNLKVGSDLPETDVSTGSRVRPRILFLSSSKGNGGADRHAVDLAAGLQERGLPMLFACRNGEFTETLCEESGVETTAFNLRNSGDVAAVRMLTDIIISRSIDVVHAHARRDFLTAALAVLLLKMQGKWPRGGRPRLVFHLHLIRTLGTPLRLSGKFFQSHVDAVIAVSDAVGAFLKKSHGLGDGTVRTIYNGVNIDSYAASGSLRARERRAAMRLAWGIPEHAVVLGMIGRLNLKGQANLLAVAEQLVQACPDLHFVFVGPERDPGDMLRFRAWAGRQNVAGRVVVVGACNDVPAAMSAFDILVHLPVDEAFGLVLVEAMASGLPVVSSAVGGCVEVVRNGETGLLVPPRDPEALLAALSTLLEPREGATRRATFGENGRRAAFRFSRQVQLEKLKALYFELCGSAAK